MKTPSRTDDAGSLVGSPSPSAPDANAVPLTEDERLRRISDAAYYRSERRGFASGQEQDDWLEAEKEFGGTGRTDSPILDDLNACLRSELSAIETYQQALEKNRQKYGKDAKFESLSQMLQEHQEAASRLKSLIQQLGGTPRESSGAWGAWAKTVMGAAKLLGDTTALKALKEGEESGVKQYEDIAQDSSAPPDVRNAVAAIMAKEHEHIRQLDRLIETAA